MGGDPWDRPEHYIAESPVYHLNKVETPLLLFFGTEDSIPLIDPMIEMYTGVNVLGKPAQLVAYDGLDHETVFDNPDTWARIIGWYQKYFAD